MDNRQFTTPKTDKITGERWFLLLATLVWGLISAWYCTLGFGSDTDAWLMAQTAEKLRLGHGYDPARSAGNPLYELLLSIVQDNLNWMWSNLLNLSLACLILWRLPVYFSSIPPFEIRIIRLVVMVLPAFWEAATSSMETLFALWLWLETTFYVNKNRKWEATALLLLATAMRPEYFLIISVQHLAFWKRFKTGWILVFTALALYLCWVWGINPLPFSDLASWFRFYSGRVFTLFQKGESLVVMVLLLISTIRQLRLPENPFVQAFWCNLGLFCIFPFEWSYLLPAMVLAVVYLPSQWKLPLIWVSLCFPFLRVTQSFGLSVSVPWSDRARKAERYQLAQQVDFQNKTLLLYGATWFSTDVKTWDKSVQNRLFHRDHSNFYVGEKLGDKLDSLHQTGFDIYIWKEEQGEFRTQSGEIQTPNYMQVIDDLDGFMSLHRKSVDNTERID